MNGKYKNVQNFINDFDKKVKCCGDIFDILENAEKELRSKTDDYYMEKNKLNYYNKLDKKEEKKTETSSFLVKLALSFSYNQLLKKKQELEKEVKISENKKNINDDDSENEKEINETIENVNNLIEELNLLLEKINNYEIDISLIKTQKIDPYIFKQIKLTFKKLYYIYYKNILYWCFHKYKKKVQKIKMKRYSNEINTFLEDNYSKIVKGMFLIKINYGSKGHKTHFYSIDNDSNTLNIRTNDTQQYPKHTYKIFKDITKIMYGLRSNNLMRKLTDKKDKDTEVIKLLRTPWRILSIFTKKRSLDLYCEDEQMDNWFYGLKFFTDKNKVNYKIISSNKFILSKIKYKIVSQLTQYSDKDKKSNALIKKLYQGKEIHKISFTKLMLLYFNLANK
jgi:hypothetical protein